MRRQTNGNIVFDEKEIPETLEGYRQDKHNLRLFYPEWVNCKYHKAEKYRVISCSCIKIKHTCMLLKEGTMPIKCIQCNLREE